MNANLLELIRKRPGMYIGDPDQRGLHCWVEELLGYALLHGEGDEQREICLELLPDGSLGLSVDVSRFGPSEVVLHLTKGEGDKQAL